MSYLLAVAIGPVQEWIAAARRTRDLWFGSLVLSEISKAAAREVEKQAKLMIFPAHIPRDNGTIANVILAEVDSQEQAVGLQKAARAAAEKTWLERYAQKAKSRVLQHIDSALWDEQAADVIEFYAAWTPLQEYKASRQRVMRLLAGRKACRNFKPVQGRFGVPKSSLDGARESVWRKNFTPAGLSHDLTIALRLSRGEHLDCIGLTKRLGVEQKFPSVSRIAADPWIRGLSSDDAHQLINECEKVGEAVLGKVNWAQYQKFPFEGTAVYRNRYPELQEELSVNLKALSQKMKALEKQYGIPEPYLAVLAADGDAMGECISKIDSPAQHRQFSSLLAEFAQKAASIVEQHSGCLVYSGGDDVLAFVPLNTVLNCSRQLHDLFSSLVPQSTLSIGIAIGHFMEPLEDLLAYVRDAERRAKLPDRNGLAVHLHPHSGVPIKIRRSWTNGPDRRLAQWSRLFREEMISSKAAYSVHELARDYQNWPEGSDPGQAIAADLVRLLGRKDLTEEGRLAVRDALKIVDSYDALNALAEELLVARRISAAEKQAEGSKR